MYRDSRALGRITAVIGFALVVAFALLSYPSQAQTYTVIHNFQGGIDGDEPSYGMTIDATGVVYGTTFEGDTGTGTIFRIRHQSSGWQLVTLYKFTGGNDGAVPYGPVVFAPNGSLYGTTAFGGQGPCSTWGGKTGCGTAFSLQPPLSACRSALCYWTETVINDFTGASNGGILYGGRPVFDHAGNMYGTTFAGGNNNCYEGCGIVYELSPSGRGWTETVLYSFSGTGGDGASPWAGVIFDQAGNLYGTTEFGGAFNDGTVFELSPSGSGWTEKILYSFQSQQDGGNPYSGLVFDQSGNLYGATTVGGSGSGGTMFELSPSGSGWNFQTLYSFTRAPGELAGGPVATPIIDNAGNIYGATDGDGMFGWGSVFKMTFSGGSWNLTTLYNFTAGDDGELPRSNLVIDSSGNLYGTAAGGQTGHGVVYEITP